MESQNDLLLLQMWFNKTFHCNLQSLTKEMVFSLPQVGIAQISKPSRSSYDLIEAGKAIHEQFAFKPPFSFRTSRVLLYFGSQKPIDILEYILPRKQH